MFILGLYYSGFYVILGLLNTSAWKYCLKSLSQYFIHIFYNIENNAVVAPCRQ